MATVHNPTRGGIWCHALSRHIDQNETVECSDEEAESVPTSIFVVELGKPRRGTERKTTPRGGKAAETNGGPDVETR